LYNFNVIWGLIGFSFAIPLCIFLLAINIEYLQTNLLKYKISIVILLLFIYHSHILPLFFVTLALFFQNILFHKTNIKKIISTSIPYLAGILLIFYFYYYFLNVETQRLGTQITTDSFVKSKLQESAFNNLILQKLYYFYFENFSYFSFKFGRLIGFIFSIILLLPLIIGTLLNKNSKIPQKIKIKQNLILYTIFYFLLIYFIYPGFNTDWQRFSVFSFLLIIVLTSSFFLKINKKIIPFTIITCLVYFFLITDFFIDYNVENKDFNKTLFEGVPKNKILSGLTLDDKFRGQHKLIHHLPDYHITWNKGIETLKLGSGYPHYQIRRKVNREILPYPQWTIGREKVYYGAFNNSDYLILRGTLEEFYDSESKKMILDNFYEIRKQGKWILFKNKKGD